MSTRNSSRFDAARDPLHVLNAARTPGFDDPVRPDLDFAAALRDRIAAMEQELRKLGGWIASDGGTVTVRRSALHPPAGPLWGHNDHRVVMSLTVLAAAAGLPVEIGGAEAVAKSWPGFFAAMPLQFRRGRTPPVRTPVHRR